MSISPKMSVNRVKIMDLPGLPDELKGRLSYELVSTRMLTNLIREQSEALHISLETSDYDARMAFDAALCSDDALIRTAAESIAQIFGRNMGYVLLTLKRGDTLNREAREEWDFDDWARWERINRVILGGGIVSGNLGQRMIVSIREVMRDYPDYVVEISPHGADLPLVGAAQTIPPEITNSVVLDFGGTMIKRAQVNQGRMVHLPSIPVDWSWVQDKNTPTLAEANRLIDEIAAIIAETWQPGADFIPVSIAAYVEDGQPMLAQRGIYMHMAYAADNVQDELGKRVSVLVESSVKIKLLHDGTAAAMAYAGAKDTAVITLGTALGIGFPY